ncbi:NEDD8-activating protein uba3 [Dionaea muscipula]
MLEDMGKPKANVAAKCAMEKVSGVKIVPQFFRIEDKDIDFYSVFNIIVLGLDSIKARSYISIICDMYVVSLVVACRIYVDALCTCVVIYVCS